MSGVSWITVTAGASRSGSGSVTYSVTPSPSTSQRIGTLTIAGQVLIVTQAANTCSYTITPGNRVLDGAGATGTIAVSTSSGCTWLATTNQTWLSVSGTGTASGSVSYTVQPNTTGTLADWCHQHRHADLHDQPGHDDHDAARCTRRSRASSRWVGGNRRL